MTTVKARPTPTVRQILAHAQGANISDETFDFTMKVVLDPIPFSVVGSGHATAQPERIAVTMSTTLGDATTVYDEVFDVSVDNTYVKITAPADLATNRWDKNPDMAVLITASDLQAFPPFSKLIHVTLIGSDHVNGADVWHIRGTVIDDSSEKLTDIYVRQSDYFPVQQRFHATGSITIDATINYTAVNTGISIDVP
jgi:hypothetical protein